MDFSKKRVKHMITFAMATIVSNDNFDVDFLWFFKEEKSHLMPKNIYHELLSLKLTPWKINGILRILMMETLSKVTLLAQKNT